MTTLALLLSLSLSPWRPGAPRFKRSALSVVRVGGQIAGYNLAQYVTTTADNVLLGLWSGATTLGFYDKSYKTISQATSQLINPVARILVPLLARLTDDPAQYRRVFIAMLQLVTIATAPGLIYAGIWAAPLMRLLLGPNWDGIGPTTSWLCLGGVVAPVYASTYWLFLSQNRASEQLRSGLVVSAVSVASFVAGLPWGAAGVAAGSGLSMVLVSVPYACRGATRSGPVPIRDMVQALLPVGLAGAGSCAAMLAILVLLPHTTLVVLTALPASYLAAVLTLAALPDGRRLFGMARELANGLVRNDRPAGRAVSPFLPPVAASAGQAIDL